MAAKEFPIEPQSTKLVDTPYRRITTAIPTPASVETLETLRTHETRSMRGQPPIVWHKVHGFQIEDVAENKWIDWSSGVLVANSGHNHPRIIQALKDYLSTGEPIMTYCFPSDPRARLVKKLIEISPESMDRVFLLTTGSEAVEVAIKLARTHGIRKNPDKRIIISFQGGFHGRTYGAQLAGGVLGGAEWVDENPFFVQVPFPSSIDVADKSFEAFERELAERQINPDHVAGIMGETFQGREAKLLPLDYARLLKRWCEDHDAALIFDEVQAGFGRTGRLFAFEHYGYVPDMVCCGKGISSTLPMACVLGRSEYLDLYGPGEMTSTHTGSPLPVIAAEANIEALFKEKMIENADQLGEYLLGELTTLTEPWRDRIEVGGVGLVIALVFFDNRTDLTPDPDAAYRFCRNAVYGGNLFFAPVGKGHATIKFCPPLCITRQAIDDALYGPSGVKEILEQTMSEAAVTS
jgi:4-aminobutyrate aminotransferase-like enzyme